MKTFKFLSILFCLILFANSVYALSFGIDLDGDGDLDTDKYSSSGYIDEIDYSSYGVVDLLINSTSDGEASGTFQELAAIIVSSDEFADDFDYELYFNEMTIIFEGSGTFTADYDGTTLGDQEFTFTTGTISIYIDDYESDSSEFGTTSDDDSFFGADDGSLVAVFELNDGSGSLQTTSGQKDNVDIWGLSTSLEAGFFFFEGMKDFEDVFNVLTSTYIQLYTNDTNEVLTDQGIISNLESELAEVMEDGNYLNMGGDGTTRIYVETEGSVEFSVVPEPSAMILLGFGLLGIAGIARKKISA